jgi:hypothetical protein
MTVLGELKLFISSDEGVGKPLLIWFYGTHIQVTWKQKTRLDVEPLMDLGKILVKGDDECYCGGPQIFQICRSHTTI